MKHKYLIIGDGRAAKHFICYLTFLNIDFVHWYRKSGLELAEVAKGCTHVIILIKDGQIEEFVRSNEVLKDKILIHCSACLSLEGVYGVHPLMTFGPDLYKFEQYKSIPFIIEKSGKTIEEIMPEFKNQHYYLDKDDKPFYHALCVMANNFSTILWQKMFVEFEKKLDMPKEVAFPILRQTAENLIRDPKHALTGPLARGDIEVLDKNIESLEGDNFQDIYKAFVTNYKKFED